MSFETTPVVIGVEGPSSTVGGLQAPSSWIKMQKKMQNRKVMRSWVMVTYAFLHPSSSTLFLFPIGSPLCQLRIVRGSLQPPSLEQIFDGNCVFLPLRFEVTKHEASLGSIQRCLLPCAFSAGSTYAGWNLSPFRRELRSGSRKWSSTCCC